MESIKLSNRLQAIASFVPHGANVADIGTDHGYIPVWLAQNEIANKLVAADIHKGPLEHAMQTAQMHHVYDHIDFRLCNGLDFPGSAEYDTVIIAGMGGEMIASIIEAAPWTLQNTTLILQPNSRIQTLVVWLTEHGYTIADTKLVKEAGKFYQILVVTAGECSPIASEAKCLVYQTYFKNQDPLLPEYLDSLLSRYKAAEQGMLTGKNKHPDLERTQSLIRDLEEMKKETETWQQ